MARRRMEEKKPDLGFEVPEFDEADFIRKETISFRTTLILFLYSIVTALVSFFIWATAAESWMLVLLVGLVLGVALRWLYPALKVDVSHFGRKEWIGTGFLYFFSWLAFIIFLVNPPLHDGVAPSVEIHVTPDVQEPGSPVNITLLAFDNVAVDKDTIFFSVERDGVPIAQTADLQLRAHEGVWSWEGTFTEGDIGEYAVTVRIEDTGSGLLLTEPHETTETRMFEITEDAVRVRASGGGMLNTPRDTVTVEVPETLDVFRVWLEPADDPEDGNATNAMTGRVFLRADTETSVEGANVYFAEPDYAGFGAGTNTFRVHVQEHDSYFLADRYDIAPVDADLVTSNVHSVQIDDASLLGDETPSLPGQRSTEPARMPGFDVTLALVALVGGAVFLVRRRNDA